MLKLFKRTPKIKKGFEKTKEIFRDSKGNKYYAFENDFDIPHLRTREIEKCLMRISAGLSGSEMKTIIEAMKLALNGGKKPDIARIGHLIMEMERREEMVLHPDLMLELVAYKYIREDENPIQINNSLHQEKIEQFRKDSMEGLKDFFLGAGLGAYMPFLQKSEIDWEEYWRESTIKIQALDLHLKAYLSEAG
jgi:hypothetical protein